MTQFVIPNRPFASEPYTGIMTPDGIFEAALGKQIINTHIVNNGTTVDRVQIYIESVSDPNIVVTPKTHKIDYASTGVSHLLSWEADFSAASPGKHMVSFIVETASGHQRIIKKIFVTKMSFNPSTRSFSVTTPEAVFNVAFKEMIGPRDPQCSHKEINSVRNINNSNSTLLEVLNGVANKLEDYNQGNLLDYLVKGISVTNDPGFTLCAPQLLIGELKAQLQLTPPFEGQYGDLPFQDPWWKVVLAIAAFVLLVAAAIAEAVDGTGDLTAGAGGTHDLPNDTGGTCCVPKASGGGTSKVAAGLLAASATAATIAGASDVRDPFRKGQDNTVPKYPGELTVAEEMSMRFSYPEAIIPGKEYKVKVDWNYQRETTDGTYSYRDTEINTNTHVLSKYEINATNVIDSSNGEQFFVKASFYDASNNILVGNQLFVQCFLIGPAGQWHNIVLQDTGVDKSQVANDGIYTGSFDFSEIGNGTWKYFVIAQDINHATPDMEPEEAAQIIGGMVLTNQLSIAFEGGNCPIAYDGEVEVR